MNTIVLYDETVDIPDGINDLAAFRRWAHSDIYWRAGIPEYWLVDAREDRLHFDILRHGSGGYVAARKQASWIKSRVFGKSFRLTRHVDDVGNPDYTLSAR